MDEIRIDGLEVFAHHGATPEEREKGQIFFISAALGVNFYQAGLSGDIDLTVDYDAVCTFICSWMAEHSCRLLESAVEQLSRELLLEFRDIRSIDLEIRKSVSPRGQKPGLISAKASRSWHSVYLGLGSNEGDREAHIMRALDRLREHKEIILMQISKLINSKPYGKIEQNEFIHAALRLETILSPQELFAVTDEIEVLEKRDKTVRWSPRTIDIDILFFDRLVMEDFDLAIPHIDLQNRDFVLKPMCEIAPWLRHPVSGKTMKELMAELDRKTGGTLT